MYTDVSEESIASIIRLDDCSTWKEESAKKGTGWIWREVGPGKNVVDVGTRNVFPLQARHSPWGFQEVEPPRFQDSRHIKLVRLSAPHTGRLYPQEISLVLISVRGWVKPRSLVEPVELCQWKVPMRPMGIEPATFGFVAQCLNQLCRRLQQM